MHIIVDIDNLIMFHFYRYPQDLSALRENEESESGHLTLEIPKSHMIPIDGATSADKKRVETKDASNGVRMFCKHCGHPVDVDD